MAIGRPALAVSQLLCGCACDRSMLYALFYMPRGLESFSGNCLLMVHQSVQRR